MRPAPGPLASLCALLGALALGATPAIAEDDPASAAVASTTVDLPSDWDAGDRIWIDVTSERIDYEGDVQKRRAGSETLVELRVLEKREDAYVFQWTLGKSELVGPGAGELSPAARELANLAEGLELRILTDEYGTPVGIENPQDVAAFFQRTLDVTRKQMEAEGRAPEETQRILGAMRALLDPEITQGLVLKQASIFLLPSGGSFSSDPAVYTDELPNPFGGAPIPSQGEFRLESLDAGRDEAVVAWRQSMDPEAAAAVAKQVLEKTMADAQMPEEQRKELEEFPLASLMVQDTARYVYDTATGWPRSVTHAREIQLGRQRRVERHTLRTTTGGAAPVNP